VVVNSVMLTQPKLSRRPVTAAAETAAAAGWIKAVVEPGRKSRDPN